jgi:hypothetical protein
MDEEELIKVILENEGIILPTRILKEDKIKELNRRLSSGRAILMKNFYDEMLKDFSQHFDLEPLKLLQQLYKNNKEKFDKHQISDDDEKIIEKIAGLNQFNLGELGNIGNLLFILELMKELEKYEISQKLKIFVMLNLYVILYETILYSMDRKIYYYLKTGKSKEKGDGKTIKAFLNNIKREEYNDHATAGEINKLLHVLEFINNEQNKSIFGDENTRIFRNKITHANFFYDEENEKIIIGKESYSIKEFLVCYYRLLNFLLKWISKVFGDLEKEDFIKNFKSKLNDLLSKLSRVFLKIERSGELKRVYTNVIFKLKSGEK